MIGIAGMEEEDSNETDYGDTIFFYESKPTLPLTLWPGF